ncbi:hypothetical protein M514_03181, partial [Trichuris suis]
MAEESDDYETDIGLAAPGARDENSGIRCLCLWRSQSFRPGVPHAAAHACCRSRTPTSVHGPGKRSEGGGACASLLLPLTVALPMVWMRVNGVRRRLLVDTGCARCIADAHCCEGWRKQRVTVLTVSGEQFPCIGAGEVTLRPPGGGCVTVDVIASDRRPLDFDFILGMSGIAALGGVAVSKKGKVRFGPLRTEICASVDAKLRIDEKDFLVTYDPAVRSWTAAWKRSNGSAPDTLSNRMEE